MDALSDELMAAEIFDRLDISSWVRCKAVCRRWRKTLLGRTCPPNEIPWLCGRYLEAPHHEFIDISLNTIYTATLPPQMLANFPSRDYKCAGSFGPWLILFIRLQQKNKVKIGAYIYNPLSSEHLTLPPLQCYCGEFFLVQARLSCMPNESNLSSSKCVVAALTSDNIYLCKPNDNAWEKVFGCLNLESYISDAAFHFMCNDQLMLYFINYYGQMTAFDVTSKTSQHIIWDYEKVFSKRGAIFDLVVDCSGDLLVVGKNVKLLDGEEDTWDNLASRVIVHKLWQGRLMRVDNLGGGMIFIGTGKENVYYCTRAACDFDFFVEDCVYYLDQRSNGSYACQHVLNRFPVNQPSSFTLPKVHKLITKRGVSWFMPMIT